MADIPTTNLDAGTDSPAAARVQILEAIQRINRVADRAIAITEQPYNAVSGTDCGAAIQAASDFLTSVGGGTLIFPVGEWRYSNALTLAANIQWQGASRYGSVLKALNDTTASITCLNARGGIEKLTIRGPHSSRAARIAAPSTCVGIIDRGANAAFKEVRVEFFKTGWQKRIGYWCNYHDLWIENNGVGWDFNGLDASAYNNVLNFWGCVFRQNDRNGIAASYTPVNNTCLNFFGCNVESNCGEDPTVYPQMALGNARVVNWKGGYTEANGITPAPDFWQMQNTSIVDVDGIYVSGARKAFFSSSNGSGNVKIKRVYWAGGTSLVTSHAYQFPSCVNVEVEDYNTHTATIEITGAGSQLINKALATREMPASHTPVLSGSGTTTVNPTYTVQAGRFSVNGNMATYAGRITVSALGTHTGNMQISLPRAAINATNIRYFGTVEIANGTLTGANTYFYGRIEPGSSQMTLYQGGSGTPLALVPGNLSATSSIQWSITYEV